MNPFDETARQAGKLDGGPFFAWLAQHSQPPLPVAFASWDDTRRLVWPGGPPRTNDLVALLQRTDQPGQPAYAIVEFETEPERHIFQRLGSYLLLLSTEVSPPPGPEEGPPVFGFLLNLTGERPLSGLALALPGANLGLWVRPGVVNLRNEDAAATLADIAAGKTGLCILPWIPLMRGGGAPALIEEWKRVALMEPDPQQRVRYRDWALVFAELSKELINWQKALEGWEMKESTVISGWMREGENRGAINTLRASLLLVLSTRLPQPVPEPVRLAIEGTNDLTTLTRWLKVAATADSWDSFSAAMKAAP